MNYELGKPKDLESITKEDVLENLIWLWAWEVGLERDYDETWQVPVIGIENIEKEFTSPIITLKIVGTELIASATYDFKDKKIEGIAFWENNEWKGINEFLAKEPIKLESLISINGIKKTEFIVNNKKQDEGFMKSEKLKKWWKFW